jgi:hypothetical protein
MSLETAVNIAKYPTLAKYAFYNPGDINLNITSLGGSNLEIIPNANLAYYYARSFTGTPCNITGGTIPSTDQNTTALAELNLLITDITNAVATFGSMILPSIQNATVTIVPGIYILLDISGSWFLDGSSQLIFNGPGVYVLISNNDSNIFLNGTITLTNGATYNNIYWKLNNVFLNGGINTAGTIVLSSIGPGISSSISLQNIASYQGSILSNVSPSEFSQFNITFNDNNVVPTFSTYTPFYLTNYSTLATFGILSTNANINIDAPSLTIVPQTSLFTNYGVGTGGSITGNPIIGGTLIPVGGTLTTALSELNELVTDLKAYIGNNLGIYPSLIFPQSPLPTTLTHGVYILRDNGDFLANTTLIFDGPGTYILYTQLWNFKLRGNVVLQGGALATDIYWFAENDTIDIYGTSIKGIMVQNFNGNFVLRLQSSTLLGCMYTNGIRTQFFSPFIGAEGPSACTLNSINYCFLRGTHILTSKGYIPIENLSVGDLVLSYGSIQDDKDITYHSNPFFTPVTWIQSFRPPFKTKETWPIRFQKDSLGLSSPRQDVWVSPTHRMIIDGKMKSACDFINGETITQDWVISDVEYFHFEVEPHSVIDAEGLQVESFINFNYPFRNQPSLLSNSMTSLEKVHS